MLTVIGIYCYRKAISIQSGILALEVSIFFSSYLDNYSVLSLVLIVNYISSVFSIYFISSSWYTVITAQFTISCFIPGMLKSDISLGFISVKNNSVFWGVTPLICMLDDLYILYMFFHFSFSSLCPFPYFLGWVAEWDFTDLILILFNASSGISECSMANLLPCYLAIGFPVLFTNKNYQFHLFCLFFHS